MDYEKKYKEAIKEAAASYKDEDRHLKATLERIFPELKEESEDERIRKEILDYIDKSTGCKRWVVWLEKQGRYKFEHGDDNATKVYKNEDGTCFNVSQLERVAKKATETEETAKEFLKSAEIMDENGKLADEYRLEKQGEKKEINLVEILKHYPRGTELYSPLYGKLWLAEVDEEDEIITCYTHQSEQENLVSFYSNGTTGLPDFTISKDCMLFLYDTEKQSGQKSVDEVEPKFKVGDFVVDNCGYTWKIEGILNQFYILEGVEGGESRPTIEWVDKTCHLWTIEDARDGDVLFGSEWGVILMFRGIGNTEWDDVIDYHCYYDCYRKDFIVQENVEYWGNTKNNQLKPATKEQRELLFQKMKEVGYMWDDEKKEPKKIEQKPTWSEEDERLCGCLIEEQEESLDNVRNDKYGHSEIISDLKEMYNERIDWLKSLKQRMKGE